MSSYSTDNFMNFFQSEDIKKYIKQFIRQIVLIVYNEIYIYVWFICFYHVFLIFIVLANLYFLLRMTSSKKKIIDV